jgi:hypothetical protein
MKAVNCFKMPGFIDNLGRVVGEASTNVHNPEGKTFLDAFLGNRLEKKDESGSFAVNPLTGDVELNSPGGFGLSASPMQRRVEGRFKIGGPDASIRQSEVLPYQGVENPMDYLSPAQQEKEKMLYEYQEQNPTWYRP